MKRLKLYILALIPQQIHHHLQVRLVRDVFGHHVEVGAVEEDLAEEFEGLSFGDVVGGEDESGEGSEELGTGCGGEVSEVG
jgi:hypothetical protein